LDNVVIMKIITRHKSKKFIFVLIAMSVFGYGVKNITAQASPDSYVPLIGISSVPEPLFLPSRGGDITFTYKVNNLGVIPLNDVSVTDDKCSAMSGELGDVNGNHLLDTNEVWIYTCTMLVTKTTTNTAMVTAYANGLKASDNDTITVGVAKSNSTYSPGLPNEGANPSVPGLPNNGTNSNTSNVLFITYGILGGIIVALIAVFFLTGKKK